LANIVAVSISQNGIRFSTGCIRRFPETEYIDFKINPETFFVAVIPYSAQSKYKMRWARFSDGKMSVRTISGTAFLQTLFELFDWKWEKRYRLHGEILREGDDIIALFNVRTPEIFSSRFDFEIPWVTGFGENYSSHTASLPSGELLLESYSEYNNEPDLKPTSQKSAGKQVRQIVKNFESGCGEDEILS
jgi:hypothetical protein